MREQEIQNMLNELDNYLELDFNDEITEMWESVVNLLLYYREYLDDDLKNLMLEKAKARYLSYKQNYDIITEEQISKTITKKLIEKDKTKEEK